VEAAVNSDAYPLSIPPGPATSAILGRIERELRDMWTAPLAPGEMPKSRACTMNLVVAAASREVAERYTAVVDEVTASMPSRAIVVTLEPESPTRALEGDATAVCVPGDSGVVCSERVRLYASGSVCARVASTVEALLVAEIPTALVWLGRVHTDDDVFTSMARSAQRVVLDTEYTSLASLVQLAKWSREENDVRPALADLAWTRLATWQELCARFFDEARTRDHAREMTRVTVRQASDSGARLGSEGALLLGWLATRLGWRATRMGGALRMKREDGRDVALVLGAVARPDGVAPGALASVEIETASGGLVMKGSVVRELASGADVEGKTADADVVTWTCELTGQPRQSRSVRLRANKGARVLERTLHRPVHDAALVESVQFAEHFFEDGVVVR
jgi:glucose-6-phosphate dehydrogenase assembly protein OpcA